MEPEVKTNRGVVRGRVEDGTSVFLGIPYAAPPVGAARFAAPIPPADWDGVREAFDYSATAPQHQADFTLIPEPVIPGDDCLSVNVFTPEPGRSGLPVLVWMHGGGFITGCSASPWYVGQRFCRDGVVVVSFNYRLGIEGFLSVDGAPANRGLLDALAALEWVQDNIAAFGGDPGDVTMGGQSAGAIGTATLLGVPRAAGLFHRVMLLSGAGQGLTTPEGATAQRAFVAERLGHPVTVDSMASVDGDTIRTAQDALIAEQERHSGLPTLLGPVLDGELVTERAIDAVRDGRTDAIDALVGTCAQEVDAQVMFRPGFDQVKADRGLERAGLGTDEADAYRRIHEGAPPWRLGGQTLTDLMFRGPAARFAEARAEAGHPVIAYELRWESPQLALGACHCLDLPFAFDVLDAEHVPVVLGDAPPQSIADVLHPALVRFVADGDAAWPRYEPERRAVMALDDTCEVVDDGWSVPRTFFTADL
jgi:para-nitrobenzyl esterase